MVLLLILSILFQPVITVQASEAKTYYARVMYDNVYLYKNPVDSADPSNLYFCLPQTYFVLLTGDANENFYSARYMEFEGYVKKDSVQAIAGIPEDPYLNNVNFRVYDERSRDLRLSPTTKDGTSGHILYLPCPTHNLTFYGKVVGESLIEARTNVWYFCKFTGDRDYYGYVYSDDCDNGLGEEISWQNNTEEVTYLTEISFFEPEAEQTSLPIQNRTTGIVIAILSVPALIFIFLIIKGSKIMSRQQTAKSKEIKDY